MKPLFTFVVLALCFQAQGTEVYNEFEMTRAIQYGIAWNVYWSTSLNSWDSGSGYEPATTAAHQMRGKEVHVTIQKKRLLPDGEHPRFFVTIDSTNSVAQRELQFSIHMRDGQICGVSSSSSLNEMVLVKSNLTVQLASDMTAPARTPPSAKEIALVKKGLHAFVTDDGAKSPQHFFVGPFNKWSPKLIVYWVEKRRFIEVGYPSEEPDVPIKSQFIQGRSIDIGDNKEGEALTPAQMLNNEKSRVFWINRWISNCVMDGVLVEVKP